MGSAITKRDERYQHLRPDSDLAARVEFEYHAAQLGPSPVSIDTPVAVHPTTRQWLRLDRTGGPAISIALVRMRLVQLRVSMWMSKLHRRGGLQRTEGESARPEPNHP